MGTRVRKSQRATSDAVDQSAIAPANVARAKARGSGATGVRTDNMHRRRGSGLVRSIVVAAGTLSILIVCFAMYQYTLVAPDAARPQPKSRLPDVPALDAQIAMDTETLGASMGDGMVGPGRDIKLTIYPRDGLHARLEIEVRDWTPKPGAPNEFLLVEPKVRMRTSDGNAVRITAGRGVLEARRRGGGNLDPERGRLTGGVVIEYDRLTDKQRAELPPDRRDVIDPADIIRIEMEQIEFDLAYSKVLIPGPMHLTARDVDLVASDLEIRFNDAQNRVESLRAAGGGRIELFDPSATGGLSLPGLGTEPGRQLTVVEWIRATLQSRLDAQASTDRADPDGPDLHDAVGVDSPSPPEAVEVTPDGIPVFSPDEPDTEDEAENPIRYVARFEGDVDVRQQVGDVVRSRLQADVLSILRSLSDRQRGEEPQGAGVAPADSVGGQTMSGAGKPGQRIIVSWRERMVVEVIDDNDGEWKDVRSRITAQGSPARIRTAEGDADCSTFSYDPDAGQIDLYGTVQRPVVVRSSNQGTITGIAVHSKRGEDAFVIDVTGPGSFERGSATANPEDDAAATDMVTFSDRLHASGRIVSKTSVDLTGRVSTRRHRLLDKVAFAGDVTVRQGEVEITAESLELAFESREGWRTIRQVVHRLHAVGDVAMTQGNDLISCRELDVALVTDSHGRVRPETATALGDVTVIQGRRTMRSSDKLIADFAIAESVTVADPAASDVPSSGSPRVFLRRIRAYGDVVVTDPDQALDVNASTLDCSIASDGVDFETVKITGAEDRPASMRMDTVGLTGNVISLDARSESVSIPGAGRMTFQSYRDLDGQKSHTPVPVSITWNDHMEFSGSDDRAVFLGAVHAVSASTTTFDCRKLEIEFDRVAAPEDSLESPSQWWGVNRFSRHLVGLWSGGSDRMTKRELGREPAYILATGDAVAVMTEFDSTTGEMVSRARIAGPRLSVNLRSDVSRMLIEGAGSLQLEDFQASAGSSSAERSSGDLFDMDADSGPSKTLISWRDSMWYDFSINQTRFEGDVSLKHFSGAALVRLFGGSDGAALNLPTGRSTFLTCDTLDVDFLQRDAMGRRVQRPQRMGRLSAGTLRTFRATGAVELLDESEGLHLWADEVIYERPREILAIYGNSKRRARMIQRRPRRLPNEVVVERMIYNLATGEVELRQPAIRGR